MKIYRLKLWYPGLPEEWMGDQVIIILPRGTEPDDTIGAFGSVISVGSIQNNTDFWEEYDPGFTITETTERSELNDAALLLAIQDKVVGIQTILRNSDGVTFNVGDDIVRPGYVDKWFNYIQKIKSFVFTLDGGLKAITGQNLHIDLEHLAQKVKIGCDFYGNDIKSGDTIYILNNTNGEILETQRSNLSLDPNQSVFLHQQDAINMSRVVTFETDDENAIHTWNQEVFVVSKDGNKFFNQPGGTIGQCSFGSLMNGWNIPSELWNNPHEITKYIKKNFYVFTTAEKAVEHVVMHAPILSIMDVAKVFVSANRKVESGPHAGEFQKQAGQLFRLARKKFFKKESNE